MAGSELLERGLILTALTEVTRTATQSHGAFVAVEGSAGLGKTRLLAEARTIADRMGYLVLTARGSELEQGFAFGVVRQLFEPALAALSPAERGAATREAAAPGAVVLGPPAAGRCPAGDFASLHGLYWLTMNLSRNRPLALVCDDLHWADESSLRFLAYLLPRLDGMPALVVAGLRPAGSGASAELLQLIATDPACELLRLTPLSRAAGSALVREALGVDAAPEFLSACHTATGGNPLLLRELAGTARDRGVAPTAENATGLTAMGADAVGRRVGLWLARLPDGCVALARALAVLGGQAVLTLVTAVAELEPLVGMAAVDALERAEIVQRGDGSPSDVISFVHPLVNAAVYDTLTGHHRADGHRRAARLLSEAGAEPQQVATHLLRVPPGMDRQVMEVLGRAAADARARGAPDSALEYLRRCLAESPPDRSRLAVLVEAGEVAAGIDLASAGQYLAEALALADGPGQRAEIAYQLGRVWYYHGNFEEAWRLCNETLGWLPQDQTDVRRRLYAGMVSLGLLGVHHGELPGGVTGLREWDPDASLGRRMLDAVVAVSDAFDADPQAPARAERSLQDGLLINEANGDTALACAWWTLLAADSNLGMASVESAIAQSHRTGSSYALGPALTFRALGWLHRGHLAEAADDLRASHRIAEITNMNIAQPFIGPWLADTLIEGGQWEQAAAALSWAGVPEPIPPVGPWYLYLASRARLRRAQGQHLEGLDDACAAGRQFAAVGGRNPAIVSWRSEAALCLHALGRADEARAYAAEELVLARRWGAPRAIGRALRVKGELAHGATALDLLEQAVGTLASTSARLEYAKALAAYGAALRRAGQRTLCRAPLAQALDLAETLGAAPLAEHVRAELRTAGARPRRAALTGPDALTPSERRVADLAQVGYTNRQIAQNLFITPKTVELHLSSCYRKLGVSRRDRLAHVLAGTSANATPVPS